MARQQTALERQKRLTAHSEDCILGVPDEQSAGGEAGHDTGVVAGHVDSGERVGDGQVRLVNVLELVLRRIHLQPTHEGSGVAEMLRNCSDSG